MPAVRTATPAAASRAAKSSGPTGDRSALAVALEPSELGVGTEPAARLVEVGQVDGQQRRARRRPAAASSTTTVAVVPMARIERTAGGPPAVSTGALTTAPRWSMAAGVVRGGGRRGRAWWTTWSDEPDEPDEPEVVAEVAVEVVPVVEVVDVDPVVEVVDVVADVARVATVRGAHRRRCRTPMPTAATVAVRPMATVARRMRTRAASRDRAASSVRWRGRGGGAMGAPFVSGGPRDRRSRSDRWGPAHRTRRSGP